ncbi:hypothetical protein Bca52824_005422 [Brassica carinata]|uniref:ADP-ribosyl cyclase/cyclic ADP-ribose hydrolase n=1 Tax=Brassica carinata TaxID=52824 RepID=A0A8X8BHI0_BRACI|nr:hypothetical protein Bca52824_005422 [Brassica carinata]
MDSSLFLTTVATAIGLLTHLGVFLTTVAAAMVLLTLLSVFLTTVAAAIGVLTILRKLRFHQEDNREEDSSSSSPSSSLSPSTVPQPSSSDIWTHDVFPSFRGEDVRRTFLSHIQMEFERKGITPFIDNEIRRGESIGPELLKAIRGSKIAIILLSRNYASSKWCLDELVEIIKCREELGQTVMTVFYEVDPSDVKKLAGDFGSVFRKTCAGKAKECIETWRQALEKVATIAGYDSRIWDNEAAMIEKIATDISNMLNNFTLSNDFDGLVGMGAHLKNMEPLLCLDSDEVRMIGIRGPPGIGKTTIARVAYNRFSNRFQLSVFMDDLKANSSRLCSDDYSAKLQLQQQFMSRITNHKDMVVSHLGVVADRLKNKKVLVVLDGVDQSIQLDAMAKEARWFGPGSRIIITTQDKRILRAYGVKHIYKVDFPTSVEALQILCTYCFGQNSPKDGFEELALEVTKLAGELPLGLRVMGSYFRAMSKQEWTNSLPRLRSSLDADIRSILKFSYDALDDEDKDLFLHIACFFNSEWVYKVEEYLAKKFLGVRQRLNVLAEKSLISIDNWRVIRMHSLLEKLGREIVCKQSINEPGQRRFLYDKREICEVLSGDATGSKSVIGIKLEYGREGGEIDISEKAFEGMSNLQFLKVYGYPDSLQLTGGLSYISHKLRLLHWKYFPVTCFPCTENLEFLVELIIPHSKLEKLWGGIKSLRSLKWMDLSDSVNLKELPELSTATNLEKLNLRNCSSLIKLPSLNGNSLEELDISGCSSLVEFPSFTGNAANLRILDLRYCSSLIKLPSLSGNSLEKLEISGCTSLLELILKGCSKLEVLPTNIILESLKKLDLAGCSSLDLAGCSIIGNAVNLRELDISSLPQLLELPSFIGKATNLEKLDLRFCSNLVELPLSLGNLRKLQRLILKGCSKLEVLPANINLESLNVLNLCDCSMLTRFPQISTNIRSLYLLGTAIEQVPPSIMAWPRLEELKMSYFENLKDFPHALERITQLWLTDTEIQEVPPWVKKMSSLNRFVLMGCRKLVSVPPISDSISYIDANDCESLEILECSFHNPKVRLNFANCFKLNQEARDLIIQTNSSSAVLPGGQVPAYFTHRATGGGLLTLLSVFLTTVAAAAIGLLTLLRKLRFHQDNEENVPSSSPSSSFSPVSDPPLSSSRIWTHHVFPSFRGEDVRRNFLSHVHTEFERKGITPFIDNEIKRGESIGPELIRAIRESKIAIILISRNYASSKWCLDELVEIMKCREELGQTVMAVFYEVDPSDVKKLTGYFGKVFRKTCAGKTKECTERWRQALAKVATIAGYHSSNWDTEATMIKKIATDISNMLNNFTPSNDFDGLVGMGAHLKKLEPLLRLGSDEVRMIGIWGPPGIGKTTIARFTYNQISANFQLSVFMDDLKAKYSRLCSDDYSAKLQLQQQFMSQITNHKDMVVSHLGVASNRLKDKKVLVVLDGVDRSVQLDAIAKEIWWFGPGSRIIITSQDQKIFRAHGVNHIYKVNFPTIDEALQIFCTYSFGQNSPKDGFEELAREVTKFAGGLPLGLKVMGSYFRGMAKQEWINSLPRLRTSLDADIRNILKFSYDALDDEDKDLFLHIACFFNSERIHKVEEYLAKKFLEVRQRLNVLAEKSLISTDWGVVRMHSLLEKLGREIVCKQSIHEPGQRQFLYDKREICDVLSGDATGSKSVIGIKLEYGREGEEIDISEKAFEGMSNLQFLRVYGDSDTLQLTRGLNYLPHKLRLLEWSHFPMSCFPCNVNLEFLVELVMDHSKLEKWEGIKSLRSLKWMNLSDSVNLKELPDLSTATNLEKLNLHNCSSLIKLPSLPGTSLEEFDISGCSSLVDFPSCIGNAINLRELDLSCLPNLVELPSYIWNATNLEKLDLSNCMNLVELPLSLGNFTKLEILILKGCSKLEVLPTNIILKSLKKLDLAGCSSLDLARCSIFENPVILQDISGCSSLVDFPSCIGNAVNLRILDLSGCSNLVELPSYIWNATNLEKLDLSNCLNLVELPLSLGNLKKLERLILKGCSKLEVLPTNIILKSLKKLDLARCSSLDLARCSIFKNPVILRELDLSSLPNMVELPSYICNATNLETLDLSNCLNLVELPLLLGNLKKLERLILKGCSKLEVFPTNIILKSLKKLDLAGCSSLDLAGCSTIVNFVNLQDLDLRSFPNLLELPSYVGNATSLRKLDLSGCSNLVELPLFIGNLQKLQRLRLRDAVS